MRTPCRNSCAFIALATAIFAVGPASLVEAAGPSMQTQAPCAGSSRFCLRFTTQNSGPNTHTMRSIVFKPPSAGNAWVQFNGTGFCTNNYSGGARGAVSFETQIVSTKAASPAATEPGGNIFSFTVEKVEGSTPNGTHAFNLGSNRVFAVPSTAAQNYYFNLRFTRMDASMVCDFYNMAFSTLFTPK